MSVNYILERDTCYLYKSGEPDAWGVYNNTNSKEELKGMIREIEELTPITLADNSVVIPTFRVSFNGNVNITSSDFLEIEGIKYKIIRVKKVKDLSGAILYTKVNL